MRKKQFQPSTAVLLVMALMLFSFGFGQYQSNNVFRKEITSLQDTVLVYRQSLENKRKLFSNSLEQVTFSSYNPAIAQTDSTPFITASGDSVDNWTIALSRDMLRRHSKAGQFSYRDTVYAIIPLVVKDTMHPRYEKTADILSFSHEASRWFGRRQGYLVKPN
ncbi:MAG: hypothetical protein LCH54_07900 [Bacteroidetes bacterium]|nr:hypothetical protein [Bacteroidota bacterium]